MSERSLPLHKVRSLTEIVEVVIDTLRLHYKPLAMGVIRYAGPWLVMSIAMSALLLSRLFNLNEEDPFASVWNSLVQLSAQLPLVVAYAASQMMATSYLLLNDRLGRAPSVEELHEDVKGRMGTALGTSILAALVLIGAAILLIFPAIYLAVPMSLVYVIRHVESMSFGQALTRARTLTKDMWWWTFAVLIVLFLLQAMIGWIGSLPVGLMTMISLFTELEGGATTPSTLSMILLILAQSISTIVSAFAALIGLTTTVYLYFSHRERIEGTTLLERIQSITPDSDTV